MQQNSKIYVAGHRGMVGSALVRALTTEGYENIVTRNSRDLDLCDGSAVRAFFASERPEYVFLAAAKVGGIHANNTYRAEFIYSNLMIATHVVHEAHNSGVKKLLFLGSSCIYPKLAPQPMREEHLLSGPLEPTNEPYAIAKIAGIKLCEAYRDQYGDNFISCMPTNLYGPNDNYDLENSHVLPALIRKFHEAKVEGAPYVEIWGDGSPRREFMHVDDLAAACLFLMQNYDGRDFVNVGTGEDISIREIADIIRGVVGYTGELRYESSRPNGTPRKLMDVSRLHALGYRHHTALSEGVAHVYSDFHTQYDRYVAGHREGQVAITHSEEQLEEKLEETPVIQTA